MPVLDNSTPWVSIVDYVDIYHVGPNSYTLIDRRYSEDALNRELDRLARCLDDELRDLNRFCCRLSSSAEDAYQREHDFIIQKYQHHKEELWRQFYANNERYYNTMYQHPGYWYVYDPYNTKDKSMPYTPAYNKKYIIIGTSGASTHPAEHTTLAAAEKEAERLSNNKPGEEFTIYSTVKSCKIEKPKPTVKVYY